MSDPAEDLREAVRGFRAALRGTWGYRAMQNIVSGVATHRPTRLLLNLCAAFWCAAYAGGQILMFMDREPLATTVAGVFAVASALMLALVVFVNHPR